MEGIQYIVTDKGEKSAVLIDLKLYKSVWEDFYDVLLAKSRENELRESFTSVKEKLINSGKINATL